MTSNENNAPASESLRRLIDEDAVGQLRRREGLMATLGSEDGVLKLDWIEGVARLLADDIKLEELEVEAREIWQRGIRHIVWAGMGGSVMAVRVLTELGFCRRQQNENQAPRSSEDITIYPLDSTDPAALNEIVRSIAETKKLTLPGAKASSDLGFLRMLLNDVMMVGVSMGMTSEEPITHLAWFTELLEQAQLSPAEHLLVMTLPGSYLDAFANEHHVPSRPLQLDGGTGTGGRMSAPATRVFLLPAALYLTSLSDKPGQLRAVLERGWQLYDLDLATRRPEEHLFVQLAAALSDASSGGACRLLLGMPGEWHAIVQWIEQLMEESLGKGGKGIVVFAEQPLNTSGRAYTASGTLHVCVVTDLTEPDEEKAFILYQPFLASKEPRERLAAVAASFLGWQLSMALYGYLHSITFAGQPAVENYKARARTLRDQDDPLQSVLKGNSALKEGIFTLLAPQEIIDREAGAPVGGALQAGGRSLLSALVSRCLQEPDLGYLDLTLNGEFSQSIVTVVDRNWHRIGNELLGVPVKLRRAPAAYHSTEQSEMDGPPFLVSLRLLVRDHEESILGTYSDTFLCAQAVSTWQAMIEQGRSCFLLVLDDSLVEAVEPLERFFNGVEEYLR